MPTDRFTENDHSKNSSSMTETSSTDGVALKQRFPTYLPDTSIPEAYENIFVDSPTLIRYLQDDLHQMGELRSWNCYSKVVEQIDDYLGESPSLVNLQGTPKYIDEVSQREANLTTFLIGHRIDPLSIPNQTSNLALDQHIILDAGIAAVFESKPGTTTESVIEISDNLLEYNYVVCFQVIDGTVHTPVPISGELNHESLKTHLTGELEVRHELLTEEIGIYKTIYTPVIDELVNEHLTATR